MKKLAPSFFTFWVDRYKVSFLLFILITVLGSLALFVIPKESSPDIKFGIISIVVNNPGVNPSDIDALISNKIYKEIKDIEGISKISSESFVGVSSTTVELRNDANIRDALTDIKDAVDTIDFPSEANDPIVRELSTQNELLFEAILATDTPSITNFELTQKARQIQADLAGINRINSIDIGGVGGDSFAINSGGSTYEIQVLLDFSRLELLGLNLPQIADAIRANNKNTPLGNYKVGEKYYDFRVEGDLQDIYELSEVIISGENASQVKLGDIAEIKLTYDDNSIRTMGFYNDPSYNYILLSINKSTGDNVFAASKASKAALEAYVANTPGFEDIRIVYSQDIAEVIIQDYKNLASTALQTLFFVFIIIFIFVGFRESLIATILLPLAFLITFISLNVLGLSLNFLTNFALVLTLGIAIDTIIVIIEGAAERQRLGYSRKNAIKLAVYDLKKPLISGTATTLVAFLPMIFLPGVLGKFLAYIPITVFSTLLAALIISLTIGAALFYKLAGKKKYFHRVEEWERSLDPIETDFLKKQRAGLTEISSEHLNLREKLLEKFGKFYYHILDVFLKSGWNRFYAIILPIFFLILSFVILSPKIGFTLFPSSDNAVITFSVEAPSGVDESYLAPYIEEIEGIAASYEELKLYYITLQNNTLSLYIELTDAEVRQSLGQKTVFDIEEEMLQKLQPLVSQGLVVEAKALENGPPSGSPVGIKLNAISDAYIGDLQQVAKDFKEYLRSVDGTKNISITSPETPGQFVFYLDREKIAFAGLNPNDLLNDARLLLFGMDAGTLKSRYEDNDIVLKIDSFQDSLSPDDIENIIVQTRKGALRFGDYAYYVFEPSLSSIVREDGKITIGVNADLQNGFLPSEIQPLLTDFAQSYSYPTGISYAAGGEGAENSELIFATMVSFLIALFLIFSILVLQFNSYTQPLIILYSVILAMLGVNVGLFLTGNPYSMTFAIGFIALTGVVVNDAIILVDRINRNIERLKENSDTSLLEFRDYIESLLQAGQSRLQPIIVTTLTTIFGILPLALQDEFWAGLGFTMIFGLTAGSFMTLFVIPTLYYVIYLKKKIRQ